MDRVEKQLLSFCVSTLVGIQRELGSTPANRLITSTTSGKNDSLFLDVFPEQLLKLKLIDEYDRHVVLVTEEKGEFNYETASKAEIVVFCDPTDRSKQLKAFIEHGINQGIINRDSLFRKLLDAEQATSLWKEVGGSPLALSGACCALTVVRRGKILMALILNYITASITVASSEHLAHTAIRDLNLSNGEHKFSTWKTLDFNRPTTKHSYTTYLGKPFYVKHFEKAGLVDSTFVSTENEPGGPSRILYMSDLHLDSPGLIVSNGEKIGEWIHWLAFCRYSRDLVAYSVYPGIFFAKDEILTSPSPPYSILEIRDGAPFVNFEKLKYFPNPSRYREMIVVTNRGNDAVRAEMETIPSRVLYTS